MTPLRFEKRIHNYDLGSSPSIWETAAGILYSQFFKIGDDVLSTIHLHRYVLLSSSFAHTATLPVGLPAAEKS
jgi:hypothetical protein